METKASLISTNIPKGDYFLTEFLLMGRVFFTSNAYVCAVPQINR